MFYPRTLRITGRNLRPRLLLRFTKLGNMALIQAKDNADLKSSPFKNKKVVYKDVTYELTRQIAELAKLFNCQSINLRQAKMAELAVKTWPMKINQLD